MSSSWQTMDDNGFGWREVRQAPYSLHTRSTTMHSVDAPLETISPLEFAMLEAIVCEQDVFADRDSRLMGMAENLVKRGRHEWVYRVPDAVTASLASLSPIEIIGAACQLAFCEQLGNRDGALADTSRAIEYVQHICELARDAWFDRANLYFAVSTGDVPDHIVLDLHE